MQHIFINIFALLLASAILLMGNGLQGTLLIVRANSEAFSLTSIGLITSAYFVGFVLGCRYIPKIVEQVGHIRTYTALASIASAAIASMRPKPCVAGATRGEYKVSSPRGP